MFSSEKARATWSEVHLDALRGLAALIVVFGHARGLFFSSLTAIDNAPHPKTDAFGPSIVSINIGNEAVMVFFALSGYLVGGSVLRQMKQNRWEWKNYLVSRLTRLWIVLIPAILIGAAIDYAGFAFFSHTHSIYTAPPGQDYVSDNTFPSLGNVFVYLGNFLFLQTIFVPIIGTNVPLWSLSNEFWYYLLFPMLLSTFMLKNNVLKSLFYLLLCSAILYCNNQYSNFLFSIWLMGAAVSLLPMVIPPALASRIAMLCAVVFFIFFAGLKKLHLPLYTSDLLMGVATCLLLYCLTGHTAKCQPSLYGHISRYLSEISYTLYLTHLPVLVFVCALISSPWNMHAINAVSLAKLFVACFLAVAWASVLYKLFESRTDVIRKKLLVLLNTKKAQSTSETTAPRTPSP